MSDSSVCPCDTSIHPAVITNPPGLDAIAYRVGDYTTFREALLLALPGETELTEWVPGVNGDLAVQMIEWWAYLCDILTFYNERIANASYLSTATAAAITAAAAAASSAGSSSAAPTANAAIVNRLIGNVGYRPRPGIAAGGTLGALARTTLPYTLPTGFQIQDKPGPGQQPQIFELENEITITPIPVVVAKPQATALVTTDANGSPSLLLSGVVTKAKIGDELLLLTKGWSGTQNTLPFYTLVTVCDIQPEKDPQGKMNTRLWIAFTTKPYVTPPPNAQPPQSASTPPSDAQAKDYRLLKSARSAHVWQYTTLDTSSSSETYAYSGATVQRVQGVVASAPPGVVGSTVDLESISRDIAVGDPILFENLDPTLPEDALLQQLVTVTEYTERIWYVNTPLTTPPPALPIPHTSLTFEPAFPTTPRVTFSNLVHTAVLRVGWDDVGELIPEPVTVVDNTQPDLVLLATGSTEFPIGKSPVLIQDSQGNGVLTNGVVALGAPTQMTIEAPFPALVPPLNVIFNMLQVSRGKTVTNEILGSGDASQSGQDFTLQNAPLTYLHDPSSAVGYKSTLRVSVDGLQWNEVDSFVNQAPTARVFITQQDVSGKTHVVFGDGVHGARLTTASNNVVANYRYGSGAKTPAPTTLTTILQPQPNLKAIVNPVPMTGGIDPDPPQQISTFAANSMLAFGRAVSLDDFTTLAAQAPGVARAQAYSTWDSASHRQAIKVYVGDDSNAVQAASKALNGAADPNTPLIITSATPISIGVSVTVQAATGVSSAPISAGIQSALLDPQTGLFQGGAAPVGAPLYESRIYAAIARVPGVQAIVNLAVTGVPPASGAMQRHDPGEGNYFVLPANQLEISVNV
ncbi:MAG TPA: hypothetical protein VKU00_10245 [Chthonomonadaceae bacterium]|nr:hypothetical protein [Chthonomonadaceae bacterium]